MNEKIIKEVLRFKLLMGYNTSKTYSDNLNEQFPDSKFETEYNREIMRQGEEERRERLEKEKAAAEAEAYPNKCAYKDKAVARPSICGEIESEGEKFKLEAFCFYSGMVGIPGETSDSGYGVKWYNPYVTEKFALAIPNNGAKIEFQSLETITELQEKIISTYPKIYDNEVIKNELERRLLEIIPLNTVKSFTLTNGNTYSATYKVVNPGFGDPTEWEFVGYLNKSTNQYYKNPVCIDTRNWRQKFTDDYGMLLQLGVVIGTIVAGAATGGAGWLLLPEIVGEIGLGVLNGYREWEKGENIGAAVSFLTGMLPVLKFSKTFRGIPVGAWDEISDALKNKPILTEDEMKIFYSNLTPDGKKAFNILVRQDEYGKAMMADEVMKGINSGEINTYVLDTAKNWFVNNPDQVVRIEFFRRLWVRELGSNIDVMLAGLLTECVFPTLNNPEKLKDFIFHIPLQAKKDLTENMLNNTTEVNNKMIENLSPEMLATVKKEAVDSLSVGVQKGITNILSQSFKDAGGTFDSTYSDPPLQDLDLPEMGESEINVLEKARQEGWVRVTWEDVQTYKIPDTKIRYLMYSPWMKNEDAQKYIKTSTTNTEQKPENKNQ